MNNMIQQCVFIINKKFKLVKEYCYVPYKVDKEYILTMGDVLMKLLFNPLIITFLHAYVHTCMRYSAIFNLS